MCFETKVLFKTEISVQTLEAYNWGSTAALPSSLSHVQQDLPPTLVSIRSSDQAPSINQSREKTHHESVIHSIPRYTFEINGMNWSLEILPSPVPYTASERNFSLLTGFTLPASSFWQHRELKHLESTKDLWMLFTTWSRVFKNM